MTKDFKYPEEVKEMLLKYQTSLGVRRPSSNETCKKCPNNTINGGTGVCYCTLGTRELTC